MCLNESPVPYVPGDIALLRNHTLNHPKPGDAWPSINETVHFFFLMAKPTVFLDSLYCTSFEWRMEQP